MRRSCGHMRAEESRLTINTNFRTPATLSTLCQLCCQHINTSMLSTVHRASILESGSQTIDHDNFCIMHSTAVKGDSISCIENQQIIFIWDHKLDQIQSWKLCIKNMLISTLLVSFFSSCLGKKVCVCVLQLWPWLWRYGRG